MFLVPARKESRINSSRRWEQAFRLYASIYCDKNPFRAKEIWQYISVIQTASTAYVWENVYGYDIVFRQLMAFNPNRSWAVMYNQMWNLSMREPIVCNRAGNNQTYTNTSRPTSNGKKNPTNLIIVGTLTKVSNVSLATSVSSSSTVASVTHLPMGSMLVTNMKRVRLLLAIRSIVRTIIQLKVAQQAITTIKH